jgi:hypothetical protein
MNGTESAIVGPLLAALGFDADHHREIREYHSARLDELLRLVPEPEEGHWLLLSEGANSQVLALHDATLFTIRLRDDAIVLSSIRCDVQAAQHWMDDERSYWRFELSHAEPVEFVSQFDYQNDYKRIEGFARIFAQLAGWETKER